MEFLFDDSLPKAEWEFDTYMTKRHLAKLVYIDKVIESMGFENVPENLIKHLWGSVYELRPHDGRVIFIVTHKDKAYILGAYIKKSNKMPLKIKKTLEQREKILLESIQKEF